jgi:hypothetical protein
VFGTLKRVPNTLQVFSRELPRYAPTRNVHRHKRFLTKLSAVMWDPEDPVADAAAAALFSVTAWGGGAAPRICRGRHPGPVSRGCHRVPGQSRRARCTARFNFLLSAARATVSFDTLSSERPAHIARCRRGSPQSGKLDGGRCVSLPQHAPTAASHYRAMAFNARTTKKRPPKDHPNICAA